MKMFCNELKEQVNKIINYEMKAMTLLTNEEKESYKNQEIVTYVEKNFVLIKIIKNNLKKRKKSEAIVITQENTEVLLIVFVIYATK